MKIAFRRNIPEKKKKEFYASFATEVDWFYTHIYTHINMYIIYMHTYLFLLKMKKSKLIMCAQFSDTLKNGNILADTIDRLCKSKLLLPSFLFGK